MGKLRGGDGAHSQQRWEEVAETAHLLSFAEFWAGPSFVCGECLFHPTSTRMVSEGRWRNNFSPQVNSQNPHTPK